MSASLQLRLYRMARAEGADPVAASAFAGIGHAEARLIDADDARMPPAADDCAVPAAMLPSIRVAGDIRTITALCGPMGRAG